MFFSDSFLKLNSLQDKITIKIKLTLMIFLNDERSGNL